MESQELTPAKRVYRRHKVVLLSAGKLADANTGHGKQSITQLNMQFQYHRGLFLQLSASVGAPVPLGITEDKDGRLFTFVRHDGPKFVLDVLANRSDNTSLVRCGLSLLIVTVSLLSAKLTDGAREEAQKHQQHHKRTAYNTSDWAAETLTALCDAGAVSVVVTLLASSVLQSVHEQCLTLLAQLVNESSDAVTQLLLPPNSISAGGGEGIGGGGGGGGGGRGGGGGGTRGTRWGWSSQSQRSSLQGGTLPHSRCGWTPCYSRAPCNSSRP